MSIKKKKVLMKAVFMGQSSCCWLIWMFHSRKLYNKINKLHERCLWIVYSGNKLSFEERLENDDSVSVHHRNFQVLTNALYKIVNGLSTEIMKEVFLFNENASYNTRNKRNFHLRSIKLVVFRSETLSYLALRIWSLFRLELRM